MTDAENAAFLAQFPAARAEVAELARLYPQCFDANGRPLVATLTWPTTRTDDMNLQTAADRYYSAAASEPATDVHPLGAPINRAKPQAEDPGKWVPATTKDYFVHTKTGALSHRDNIPFPERPWHKPATVTMDLAAGPDQTVFVTIDASGNRTVHADDSATCAVPSVDDFLSAVGAARERGAITEEIRGLMVAKFGAPKFTLIPADRRADVIAALNALGA